MKKNTNIGIFGAVVLLACFFVACGSPNNGETPVTPVEQTYTVTVASGIRYGTLTVDHESATAGTSVGITANPNNTGIFKSLAVMAGDQNVEVTESNSSNSASERHFTFTMPQHNVTVSATFVYNYPAPTTVTLGAENSGYTVYKAVGDFDFDWQTRPDSRMAMSRTANDLLPTENEAAEHYFSEYENTVNDAVADIEANLVNYNQATQDYIQPWLDNIKAQNGKYDRQHIDQTLEVIYNGSSFLFTDLIKSIPLDFSNEGDESCERIVLRYSIQADFNEQYKKGFGFNNNQMDTRYTNKKTTAINKLKDRSGLSQEDLGVDIDYHNCAQVVNILNQKLSTALNYLNQTKGTNIDLSLMKQAINLNGSTQAVTAVRDLVKGNIKNYALDNNMDNAIEEVINQAEEN